MGFRASGLGIPTAAICFKGSVAGFYHLLGSVGVSVRAELTRVEGAGVPDFRAATVCIGSGLGTVVA